MIGHEDREGKSARVPLLCRTDTLTQNALAADVVHAHQTRASQLIHPTSDPAVIVAEKGTNSFKAKIVAFEID